jgi:hypothetical protein
VEWRRMPCINASMPLIVHPLLPSPLPNKVLPQTSRIWSWDMPPMLEMHYLPRSLSCMPIEVCMMKPIRSGIISKRSLHTYRCMNVSSTSVASLHAHSAFFDCIASCSSGAQVLRVPHAPSQGTVDKGSIAHQVLPQVPTPAK